MRLTIAILATLFAAGAFAQSDRASRFGPFTSQEAELIDAVWSEIREAAAWEDIDWEAVGLNRAPGSPEARRFMASNWGTVRQAAEFDDIDWQATKGSGYGSASRSPFEDADESGPFSRQEAELLSRVWPEIRQAAAFEDIDWRAVGLSRAPGDSTARRLMATHWGSLRRAADFRDIDWEAITSRG
jgi:hypothetical protein